MNITVLGFLFQGIGIVFQLVNFNDTERVMIGLIVVGIGSILHRLK